MITAFDGDRTMAVYIGEWGDTEAARTGLQLNYAVNEIINPRIKAKFKTPYTVKQAVSVDRGTLRAVRTGIRGSNDLVWVGTAANLAAKMCALRSGYSTYISEEVYKKCDQSVIYGSDPKQHMRSTHWWDDQGKTLYRSTWQWQP